MAQKKLTLQDVARAASDRNGGKGGRSLQRLAKHKGLTLSFTTVDRILNGKYESTPQRQTIEALAVLAEMPLEDVYEAAGLPLPMASFAEQLPDGSDQLTVHQRRVVLDVIRGFIRDNRRVDDLESRVAALRYDATLKPIHPRELLRQVEAADFATMDVADLDLLHTRLVLALPPREDLQRFQEALDRATSALKAREHELRESDDSEVERDAQPDGVKQPDPVKSARIKAQRAKWDRHRKAAFDEREPANARPWEDDEYGLAAKRGRNRGREAREQQDRDVEDGGT